MSRNIIPQNHILLVLGLKNHKILITKKERTTSLMEVHEPRLAIHDFIMSLIILGMSIYSKLFQTVRLLAQLLLFKNRYLSLNSDTQYIIFLSHEEKTCLWIYKIKSTFLMKEDH